MDSTVKVKKILKKKIQRKQPWCQKLLIIIKLDQYLVNVKNDKFQKFLCQADQTKSGSTVARMLGLSSQGQERVKRQIVHVIQKSAANFLRHNLVAPKFCQTCIKIIVKFLGSKSALIFFSGFSGCRVLNIYVKFRQSKVAKYVQELCCHLVAETGS